MRFLHLPSILTLLTYTTATPITPASSSSKPLPLLIWHGLGDKYDAEGLQSVGELAQEIHPGTYVHFIRLDDDGGQDRVATFFGNVTTQIEEVCGRIHNDTNLSDKHGRIRADALGFSQGGQFLRGLIQRCEGLDVRSLVTFGSQHNGIAQFQECGPWDWVCKGSTALIKGNAWTDYAQNKVVPAQYYRTVNESTGLASEDYLAKSNFLADVNNEREEKNATYKKKLARLEKLVMFVFGEDTTVIPKESGWFAEVNGTSGEVTPLQERSIYKEDWIGLKKLDKKGALVFKTTPGRHMELSQEVLEETFEEYFGPEKGWKDTVAEQGSRLGDALRDAWSMWRSSVSQGQTVITGN